MHTDVGVSYLCTFLESQLLSLDHKRGLGTKKIQEIFICFIVDTITDGPQISVLSPPFTECPTLAFIIVLSGSMGYPYMHIQGPRSVQEK